MSFDLIILLKKQGVFSFFTLTNLGQNNANI